MIQIHEIEFNGYEKVIKGINLGTGFIGYIAIHSTTLGPALGGCRYKPYRDMNGAIIDVLRLAQGMTMKSSLAGLNLGGGKAVIMELPGLNKTDLLKDFAQMVNYLEGIYYTAEDIGTTVEEMAYLKTMTPYVVSIQNGDPSPSTAYGVLQGIKACYKHRYNVNELTNVPIFIQGAGKVGQSLIQLLSHEGAIIWVCDINKDNFSYRPVDKVIPCESENSTEFYDALSECLVFSPCATGNVINRSNITEYCKHKPIICGSANNQLQSDAIGKQLYDYEVLYAPDYLVNAGGVINVATEIGPDGNINMIDMDFKKMKKDISSIYQRTLHVLELSKITKLPSNKVADILAFNRLYGVVGVIG